MLLRITESQGEQGRRVDLELAGDGRRRTARVSFDLELSDADREDIRWYLEDYLEYPVDPAPTIAAGVERRLSEIGDALFDKVFYGDRDATAIWDELRGELGRTRIEIVASVEGATALPWELLREPASGGFLALRAQCFTRSHPGAGTEPPRPEPAEEAIRVLFVICRPSSDRDVPFRSVASHLVRLSPAARTVIDLDVLRPPTFAELSRRVAAAQAQGRPYHVVHFDGHGVYMSKGEAEAAVGRGLLTVLSPLRDGSHGYLVFEDPRDQSNRQLVDGPALGRQLRDSDVPVLVMNACRSAHADLLTEPAATPIRDAHERVRAYGSLAHEVSDSGVGGVVAMRYNVYVVTAAKFVAELYAQLAAGSELGEAVTAARKVLANEPLRDVVLDARPLQDWSVPLVYETTPLTLLERVEGERPLKIEVEADAASDDVRRLAPEPQIGFFGRDETLLALDRGFDSHSIILLHAWAGEGKTATAGEFARWYELTGAATRSNVLATSFEQHTTLAAVLDQFAERFSDELLEAGIDWSRRSEADRREIVLQAMAQRKVLWIWDNVEPITGFPEGTPSLWTADEQRELADFLRDAQATQAKILLTSRRPEHEWLGLIPRRVELPPMPMLERIELARALARRHGHDFLEVADWRPLLRFSQGNPLAITALVSQALRDRIHSREAIEEFVEELGRGSAHVQDDEEQGRSKSLAASLSYGFEHSFNDSDRARLALLHLFQGFVDAEALGVMGAVKDAPVPTLTGLKQDDIHRLLDRAAEIGTLMRLGGGYYRIHPAIPWHFQALFEQYYGGGDDQRATDARIAYARAMGVIGNAWHTAHEHRREADLDVLRGEEANLRLARHIALEHDDWPTIIGTMQGLHVLYDRTGRRQWVELVHEVEQALAEAQSTRGREALASEAEVVHSYVTHIALVNRDWSAAEDLLRRELDASRKAAAPVLDNPPPHPTGSDFMTLHNLVTDLISLANVLREQHKAGAVELLNEALGYARLAGDRASEATVAFNLGAAYMDESGGRQLEAAEKWFRASLELRPETDTLGIARSLGQLGGVAVARARSQKRGSEKATAHLKSALEHYVNALNACPADATRELSTTHHQVGLILAMLGSDAALTHYDTAIRLRTQRGDMFGRANTRFNTALFLMSRRPDRALLYARAALDDYLSHRPVPEEQVETTRNLIEELEGLISEEPAPA